MKLISHMQLAVLLSLETDKKFVVSCIYHQVSHMEKIYIETIYSWRDIIDRLVFSTHRSGSTAGEQRQDTIEGDSSLDLAHTP